MQSDKYNSSNLPPFFSKLAYVIGTVFAILFGCIVLAATAWVLMFILFNLPGA